MNHKEFANLFYHIYPLGMCACPRKNDFSSPKADCLLKLIGELDNIKSLGTDAIYIGPLFESSSHGYDTVDYYWVDRRIGNNQDFILFVEECHKRGIKVIVDAVFNHTGRDFFAFKDLIQNGKSSQYKDWYLNINFDYRSPYGDNFTYDGWAGCMDLVKLNVDNQQVRQHIFGAVKRWIEEFKIDGLRLDAADVLSPSFLDALHNFCQNLSKDFFLVGEVVHGDYNNWVKEGRLDSVTNYQLYKGMWSSFNSANMFEVAWSLNEQFGENGKYKNLPLYTFLENHDVNRLASTVSRPEYLVPLYGLMFTVPGIPSVYYKGELGLYGKRGQWDDYELRPAVPPFVSSLPDFARPSQHIDSLNLFSAISRFAQIRKNSMALKKGTYTQLALTNTSFAFLRKFENQEILVLINQADSPQQIDLSKAKQILCYRKFSALNTQRCIDLDSNPFIEVEPISISIFTN